MAGQPKSLSTVRRSAPDEPPRRPPAGARARLSIRELVDRELRGALVAAVADLPRRPSEAYDDLARGATRPTGKLPERIAEAATHGASRERVKREIVGAVARAVDIAFDAMEAAA